MGPLEAGLRGGFVALMLVLAWRLLRGPRASVPLLGGLMALGAAAYALQAPQAVLVAQGVLPVWQVPLQVLMNGNPVLMWLLSCALFDDDFRLRRWHAVLWAGWVALGLGNCTWWRLPLLGAVAEAGPLLAALAALWPLLRAWRGDLVEGRLRMRRLVLGLVLGYSVLSALAGIPSPGAAAHPWLGLADAAALLVLGLLVSASLLQLQTLAWWLPATPAGPTAARADEPAADPGVQAAPGSGELGPVPAPAQEPATGLEADVGPDVSDPGALARLQRAIDGQQVFRREGLTIGALAAELGLPEYRLRRLINQQLGHRNFNTYLNGHRIAWAQAALADPARAEVPVLTLALEAGFQSLGPFNRAFKAVAGCTPTEFRSRALADRR